MQIAKSQQPGHCTLEVLDNLQTCAVLWSKKGDILASLSFTEDPMFQCTRQIDRWMESFEIPFRDSNGKEFIQVEY